MTALSVIAPIIVTALVILLLINAGVDSMRRRDYQRKLAHHRALDRDSSTQEAALRALLAATLVKLSLESLERQMKGLA